METYKFRAMNSDITFAAVGEGAEVGFKAAQYYMQFAEQRFSRFIEDSELSRMNRSAGKWFKVSPEMMSLLQTALECHEQTEGMFDPAILPDLRHAGYTSSFDVIRLGADLEPVRSSQSRSKPFSTIQLNVEEGNVLLPVEMQIDLGGIAKGWIAEQTARVLADYSPVCAVNAGGDMFLVGHPLGGWEVQMEDPRDPSQDLMTLIVEDGAVVTSSIAKRVWKQGDKQRHHLIDPRSGEPAETPWLSVTCFAETAAKAETFAKSVLIGGPDYAERMLLKFPELNFLAVNQEGQIWSSIHKKELVRDY
ncbi:MAG: FAD:protein FMN transferase [Anaerolineales bacterium]|nr:FAD:protein FMN transferase [Anaerolineales bacterium]